MGYGGLHNHLRKARGRAREHACVDCGETADHWSYDHDCPEERVELRGGKRVPYSLDLNRYQPRCQSCHVKFDNTDKPCFKPGCKHNVRGAYMYCCRHSVNQPLRKRPGPGIRTWTSGRVFGHRMPTDDNGRAYAARTTVTASFTHKVCGQCKVRKPVASFSTRGAAAANRPDPFKSRCLECDRQRANARYAKRKAQRDGTAA